MKTDELTKIAQEQARIARLARADYSRVHDAIAKRYLFKIAEIAEKTSRLAASAASALWLAETATHNQTALAAAAMNAISALIARRGSVSRVLAGE